MLTITVNNKCKRFKTYDLMESYLTVVLFLSDIAINRLMTNKKVITINGLIIRLQTG